MHSHFRRPRLEPSGFFDKPTSDLSPDQKCEMAHESAALLVNLPGNSATRQALIRRLDAELILADLAELWSESSPGSLAGCLWRLYQFRQLLSENPNWVIRLYEKGLVLNTTDPCLAGLADPVSAHDLKTLSHTLFTGAFGGDLSLVLERVAAFYRVMSAGVGLLPDPVSQKLLVEASGWLEIAENLSRLARRRRAKRVC